MQALQKEMGEMRGELSVARAPRGVGAVPEPGEGGVMEGYGILTWHDGSRYEGDWAGGKRHGRNISSRYTRRYANWHP